MLHFYSQADHQLYLQAISQPVTGKALQEMVNRKISGDEPRSLFLAPGNSSTDKDANGVSTYFDWMWFKTPYNEEGQPIPVVIGQTDLKPYRIMNGGFLLSNGQWSSHS
jgi:hypothetical protein